LRRIILDTNVLVSALLSVKGNESLVLRHALSGEFEIGVSTPILNEYRIVLERPKFTISRTKLDELFSQLEAHAKLVNPVHTVDASPDESEQPLSRMRRDYQCRVPHYRKQAPFSRGLEGN
jgi:putative PIN family toxin of toxin-antitoxin system